MNIGFSVNETVNKRYSVRTYDSRPVDEDVTAKILEYANSLQNPLGPKIRFQFIEKETAPNGEKLGTYGIIKGAKLYLGATMPDEEFANEAMGYDYEQLVLYATSLGLGTCWLGGTFNRSAFAEAMEIRENEIFPILSPVGYPAAKKSVTEKVFRSFLKADARKPWEEIFFADNFNKPLTKEMAGEYEFPLEMLRLAPSATNSQPWRVVFSDNAFHFIEQRTHESREGSNVDMHRIDLGIGICHFHLAALEKGLNGHFERKMPSKLTLPPFATYITSWVID